MKRPANTAGPPPRNSPAVIRAGEVYSLAELRRRLGWQEHAVRQARAAGLRLIPFGREKFVLGTDVLTFFRGLAARQGHKRSEGGEGDIR